MSPQTRYYCTGCGLHKFVPERPLSCERNIRTGCSRCNGIIRHYPVGMG